MRVSLTTMPNLVLNYIIENLDFLSVVSLRKVCWDLRSRIVGLSNYGIKECDIRFDPEKIVIYIDGTIRIQYCNHDRGTSTYFQKNMNPDFVQNLMRDKEYLDTFFDDIGIFMRTQKTILEEFCVYCEYFNTNKNEYRNEYSEFLSRLEHFLNSRRYKIKSRKVAIGLTNQDDFTNVFSCVDSKILERAYITNELKEKSQLEIDRFLKRWTQCTQLKIPYFYLNPTAIRSISHMERVEILLQNVDEDDFITLKQEFTNSKTLEHVTLYYETPEEKYLVQRLGIVFQTERIYGKPHKNWFFPYPDSDFALEISAINFCRKQLRFEKIPLRYVPDGYLITK